MMTIENDDLNSDAPCARCGAPTIRGLNTDFCSLDCEEAFAAEHPKQGTCSHGVDLREPCDDCDLAPVRTANLTLHAVL